jgi:hypothetical protein
MMGSAAPSLMLTSLFMRLLAEFRPLAHRCEAAVDL